MNSKNKKSFVLIREYTPSNPSDIDKAIKEIEKLGIRNPIDPNKIVIDNTVVIEVQNFDERLMLSSILSIDKNKGNASNVMKKITDIADKYHVTIALTPEPFGRDANKLTKSQLIKFYKKFGFKNDEFGDMERISEQMISTIRKNTETKKSGFLKLESNLLGVSKPYEIYVGDRVRNINPTCTHYRSTGTVLYVHDDGDITYQVDNKGSTYTPGDELTKSADQLMKVLMRTPRPGYGMASNE